MVRLKGRIKEVDEIVVHIAHNNSLQPTAQPLRGFASAELHRYGAGMCP